MGFFDDIKARITGEPKDNYDDYDEYYDDRDYDDEYDGRDFDDRYDDRYNDRFDDRDFEDRGSQRPPYDESHSVTVISRNKNRSSSSYGSSSASFGPRNSVLEAEESFASIPRGPVPAARRSPSSYGTGSYGSSSYGSTSYGARDSYASPATSAASAAADKESGFDAVGSFDEGYSAYGTYGSSYKTEVPSTTEPKARPAAAPATSGAMVSSTPTIFIFEPDTYNQAEQIARRLRDGQPVALSLLKTKIDVARRILDFSFGVTCGLGGTVEKVSEKVFVLLPDANPVSEADMKKLRSAGYIRG